MVLNDTKVTMEVTIKDRDNDNLQDWQFGSLHQQLLRDVVDICGPLVKAWINETIIQCCERNERYTYRDL